MKKNFVILFALLLSSLVLTSVSAAQYSPCDLRVSLLNQDPIHAVPGEYVDLVFQLSGISNPDCKEVSFEIIPNYPFSLDPGVEASKVVKSGTFTSNYNSQATIPVTLRVDKDALDRNYEAIVRYSTTQTGGNIELEKRFNVSVEDVKTNFEVFVDDYSLSSNILTISILNIGKNDVEALIVEAPKQDNLAVKGSNKAIVGTLDSNQDTTFSYEATPSDGNITLSIQYNDENGERRVVEKAIVYDSSYFTGRAGDVKKTSPMTYIFYLIIIGGIIYWVRKKFFKKKEQRR